MVVDSSARRAGIRLALILEPLEDSLSTDEAIALDVVEAIAARMTSPQSYQVEVVGFFVRANLRLYRAGLISSDILHARFLSAALNAVLGHDALVNSLTTTL